MREKYFNTIFSNLLVYYSELSPYRFENLHSQILLDVQKRIAQNLVDEFGVGHYGNARPITSSTAATTLTTTRIRTNTTGIHQENGR